MSEKQQDQKKKTKHTTDKKSSQSPKLPLQPDLDSPMDRFNKALRKILSVPKKDTKKDK